MDKQVYYKNGFNPPLLIVGNHHDPSAAWVVPAALPWASAMCVRRDQLQTDLRCKSNTNSPTPPDCSTSTSRGVV